MPGLKSEYASTKRRKALTSDAAVVRRKYKDAAIFPPPKLQKSTRSNQMQRVATRNRVLPICRPRSAWSADPRIQLRQVPKKAQKRIATRENYRPNPNKWGYCHAQMGAFILMKAPFSAIPVRPADPTTHRALSVRPESARHRGSLASWKCDRLVAAGP